MGIKKKLKKKTKKLIKYPFKKWKELLLLLVILVVCLVVLNLITPLIYKAFTGRAFDKADIAERLAYDPEDRRGEMVARQEGWTSGNILHPYLGYVMDYNEDPTFNKYGFRGPEPFIKRSPERLVVALTGGSVADELFYASRDTLRNALRNAPILKGKDVEVVSIGLGGFKQPQQLLSLTYLLSLGAEFDIVINIDGFNEISLPYGENVPDKVAPAFPRSWKTYSMKRIDIASIKLMGRLEMMRGERLERKRLFSRWPLTGGNFTLAIWDSLDTRDQVKQVALQKEISDMLFRRKPSHQVSGPFEPFPNEAALFGELVNIWKNSSVQMGRLTRQNSTRYFHFLQPNQYVKDSKEFTTQEWQIALTGGEVYYSEGVEKGYALLQAAGKELSEELSFTDLTMLFKDEKRDIYRDNCCHFTKLGYDMIAHEMARVIAADLSER